MAINNVYWAEIVGNGRFVINSTERRKKECIRRPSRGRGDIKRTTASLGSQPASERQPEKGGKPIYNSDDEKTTHSVCARAHLRTRRAVPRTLSQPNQT